MQEAGGIGSNGKPFTLDGFTLMFTTKVGLQHCRKTTCRICGTIARDNLAAHQELNAPFLKKSMAGSAQFFQDDFDGAFKLAVPKSCQNWLGARLDTSTTEGDQVISSIAAYRRIVSHAAMAMAVKRQEPPKERRGPDNKQMMRRRS